MAVAPTGAMYKSLSFDGEDSRDYGVYITGEAVYNAPERDVEMITIPGRNGSFALDNGRFENIEVTYPAGIFADTEADFRAAISDFRNFLCSRNGYVRLQDEYNPDEYRMAVYKSGLDVSPAQLKAGKFDIVFDCKPQRFLVSGEEAVDIGVWGDTDTETDSIVEVDNPDGILAIKDLTADIEPIQDLNGYDAPWAGGAGKNKCPKASADESYIAGLTMSVATNGEITLNGTTTATNYIRGEFDTPLAEGSYTFASFNPVANSSLQLSLRDSSMNPAGGWHTLNAVNKTNSFTSDAGKTAYYWQLQINSGVSLSNFKFNPMLVVGSTAPTTFEPYENICPISGHTDVVVVRANENLAGDDGHQVYVDSSGVVTASATYNSTVVKIKQGQTYIVKLDASSTATYGYFRNYPKVGDVSYDASRTVVTNSQFTFSAPIDGYALIRPNSTNSIVSINKGTTALNTAEDTDVYTIALGTTVYGGTLDVTTGVLTVTHAIVDMGDLSWNRTTSYANPLFYTSITAKGTETDGTLSSAFHTLERAVASASNFSSYSEDGDIASSNGNTQVYVRWDAITDKTTFTTNVTGQKLVYPLATPTTTTLTAQEIDLLLGQNNIWASSGEVTVEYGQDPNILVNPTLFDARPMLEVTGYGDIGIGSETVTVNNVTVGDVTLAASKTRSNGSVNQDYPRDMTITVALDNLSLLNPGDTISISGVTVKDTISVETSLPLYYLTTLSISSVSGMASYSSQIISTYAGNVDYTTNSYSFVYGTASTSSTSTLTVYMKATNQNNQSTTDRTVVISVSVAYDGDDTITVSITQDRQTMPNFYKLRTGTVAAVIGTSSISLTASTVFIDLDLGEAYAYESGSVVSMNNAVEIPADLPALKSGSTTITYDNTVTQLKVTPRWWKI